jgi:putative NIF3 family GTP cyclohydrolase 1 type 2
LHFGEGPQSIRRVAWCTGAAQGYLSDAVKAGVDAYITGEASEQTVHEAREQGIHCFAAGHHATERYGVKALGDALANALGIRHQFLDCDNPV